MIKRILQQGIGCYVEFEDGRVMPLVFPDSVDDVHVFITCPFCFQRHVHGSCGGKDYGGPRQAHCKLLLGNSKDYCLAELVPLSQGDLLWP